MWIPKTLLVILIFALHGQVLPARIYGGQEAVPYSRPYMVLLERRVRNQMKYCDGFLLSEDFVMTAAHCKADSYNALLGVHNFNKGPEQNISVKQAFPHQDFDQNHVLNDIMLLKLSTKASFSGHVKAIRLAGAGGSSLPGHCLVSGWGSYNRERENLSPTLREINVTLIEDTECAEEHLYCSSGEKGPACGDSGGPLVCENALAFGIVSFAAKEIYGFTKISDYKAWINSVLKN